MQQHQADAAAAEAAPLATFSGPLAFHETWPLCGGLAPAPAEDFERPGNAGRSYAPNRTRTSTHLALLLPRVAVADSQNPGRSCCRSSSPRTQVLRTCEP